MINHNDLKGKVAIVTGVSSGIGEAIALSFIKSGITVIGNHYSKADENFGEEQAINRIIGYVKEINGRMHLVEGDIAEESVQQELVFLAVEKYGKIDILVNNAGIAIFEDFLMLSPKTYDKILNTNLRGAVFLTQKVIQEMVDREIKGSIINMSSVSGTVNGETQLVPYRITKAGLYAFTMELAAEFGSYGIRANAIAPGVIRTRINSRDLDRGEREAEINRRIPIGRVGEPKDVADLVLFLASESSSYINGELIRVDGGLTSTFVL